MKQQFSNLVRRLSSSVQLINTERKTLPHFKIPGEPRRRERLPIKVKAVIPEGVEDLLEDLRSQEFATSTPCWKCEQPLPLEDLKFEWPIGPFGFYFPGVPGYHCDTCGETYFPNEVLDALGECVEDELARRNPQPPFRNPNRLQEKTEAAGH